jgi:glycosyltransferase involved in cell wall biosynthesis
VRIGIDASLASLRGTGTGRYAAQLLARLLELDRDNEYVLYVRRRDARDNPLIDVRRPGVRVRVTDAPLTLVRVHVNLPACLRRDRIDVYHSLAFFLPLCWPGKTVVTIHDIHPVLFPGHWNRPGTRLSYWALRAHIALSVKRATRILAPSEYTRQTVCQRFGTPPERIVVTPEAAAPFFFAPPLDGELAATERRFGGGEFFLAVGMRSPLKNVTGLVEAFGRLRRCPTGRSARLVVVGQPLGARGRSLRRMIHRLGLADAIRVEAYVDDATLRALYRKATAVVVPSLAEGFGLPALEAMACGAATVISRTPALCEVAGDAALRVDPDDPEELAQVMERLLREPALRRALAASGRHRAAAFSWERTARQTLRAYEEAATS